MNKVILIGNLTHDPELKELSGDKKVCKLRLAVNGYKKDETVYVDVDTWQQLGEICHKYLNKGRKVAVSGRLSLSQWETEGGEKRQKLFVVADDVEFVSPKTDESEGGSKPAPSGTDASDDDDIPF